MINLLILRSEDIQLINFAEFVSASDCSDLRVREAG